MDSEKKIEQLLEKYWACETSLEEEQELRDYFGAGSLPQHWKETGELFRYFEGQKKAVAGGADFDDAVLKKIREAPKGKKISFQPAYVLRIAAGVFVVAAASVLVLREVRKSYPKEIADTYSDPKLALEETKKAFMLISKSFGKAEKEAQNINMLNDAEQRISEKKEDKKKSI